MTKPKTAPTVKAAGKTLADLRAVHDKAVVIPNRIKSAIDKLAAVSWQEWAYESDFKLLTEPRLCDKDLSDYREQFKEFWALLPSSNGKRDAKKVWFATERALCEWKGEPWPKPKAAKAEKNRG